MMSRHLQLSGRTAVITGAASGIGRAVAVSFAKRGCHLALVDVNVVGLHETERAVHAGAHDQTIRISHHIADVSNRAAVARLPEAVLAEHPRVDVLVNNAGVAAGGKFETMSTEDFDWLIGINLFGVIEMSRVFLPLLRKSDDARIVNVSSVWGILAPARHVAYATSKFAVRGFSDALNHELLGSTVGVTTVFPGGIATSIADNARSPAGISPNDIVRHREYVKSNLRFPADRAGELIVRGVERRKRRVLIGNDARFIALLARVLPVSYWALLKRLIHY